MEYVATHVGEHNATPSPEPWFGEFPDLQGLMTQIPRYVREDLQATDDRSHSENLTETNVQLSANENHAMSTLGPDDWSFQEQCVHQDKSIEAFNTGTDPLPYLPDNIDPRLMSAGVQTLSSSGTTITATDELVTPNEFDRLIEDFDDAERYHSEDKDECQNLAEQLRILGAHEQVL